MVDFADLTRVARAFIEKRGDPAPAPDLDSEGRAPSTDGASRAVAPIPSTQQSDENRP
jgi:hypothetical protein